MAAALDLEVADDIWSFMAPELLLSRLHERGVNSDVVLRSAVAGGRPNALHYIAAMALARGAAVWTTNVDELIEDACRDPPTVIVPPATNPLPRGRPVLHKPHGTLSSPGLVVRREQVLTPLPPSWAARLASDCRDAEVAVVGYAGADIDLRAALATALSDARSVSWFAVPGEEELLTSRFPALPDPGVCASDRPDVAFAAWAQPRGLATGVPSDVWRQLHSALKPVRLDLELRDVSPLLRGLLLDDFGIHSRASRLYRRAALRGPHRRDAAGRVARSGLIHGAWWRPIAILGLEAATKFPLTAKQARVHAMLGAALSVDYPPARRVRAARRALRAVPNDAGLQLAAAHAVKEVDPAAAIDLAEQARVADPASPKAGALFFISFASRWLGDLQRAEEAAADLADTPGGLGGPVWLAWANFERGAVNVLRGDHERGLSLLARAERDFELLGEALALFDAVAASIPALRLLNRNQAAIDAYEHAEELMRRRVPSRFRREVLMAESAELARAEGRLVEAGLVAERLTQSPTVAQEILGHLTLGEVQRAGGHRCHAARRALERSQQVGFGYGEVHAAVTLALADEMSNDEAESVIQASRFDAPERAGVQGLLRFCQGPVPELHIIAFP